VPVFDEVVISTARMNKVINIDPTAGRLWSYTSVVWICAYSRMHVSIL